MLSGMTTALDPNPAETTERGSAYPPGLDQLLPQARAFVKELGRPPSRNELMRHLKIGGPKANAVRTILAGEDLLSVADKPGTDGEPAEYDGQADEQPARTAEDLHPVAADPDTPTRAEPPVDEPEPRRPLSVWPLLLIAIPAAVSIWVGWVGLGGLTGFGDVRPLPGIVDHFTINSAITLPVGMEAYAAFALRAWLGGGRVPARARRFARWSAIGALTLGALGQIAYHLMAAAGVTQAPWPITTAVACLPVAVLGMGAALAHLLREGR
jgi:hypothetical protein